MKKPFWNKRSINVFTYRYPCVFLRPNCLDQRANWNFAYDDVINLRYIPPNVDLITYVDGLVITIKASRPKLLELQAREVLTKVCEAMTVSGVTLATAKSKGLLFVGRKSRRIVRLSLSSEDVVLFLWYHWKVAESQKDAH